MASATEQIVRLHFDRLLKQHDSSVCDELLWTDPHDHEADPQREQEPASTKTYLGGSPNVHLSAILELHGIIASSFKVAVLR